MVRWLFLLVLLLAKSASTVAEAILGCAFTGAQSHYMSILSISRELSARGHSFTMLLSSTDKISLNTVNASAFPALRIIEFAGPSGVLAPGSDEWAAAFSRDTSKVGTLVKWEMPLAVFQRCPVSTAAAEYQTQHQVSQRRMSSSSYVVRDLWLSPYFLTEKHSTN